MNIFRLMDRQLHHWMIGPHLHKLESLENIHPPSNKNNNSNLSSGPANTSFFPCVFFCQGSSFPDARRPAHQTLGPDSSKMQNGVNHHLRKRLSVILGRWCFFLGGVSPRCFLHKFVFVPLGHEMFKTLLTWRMEEPNNLHKPFLTKYAFYDCMLVLQLVVTTTRQPWSMCSRISPVAQNDFTIAPQTIFIHLLLLKRKLVTKCQTWWFHSTHLKKKTQNSSFQVVKNSLKLFLSQNRPFPKIMDAFKVPILHLQSLWKITWISKTVDL